jgi:hypothetical protein
MAAVKSGINKVGNNYYQSITLENSDGSVGTTLYRVDAKGNNGVPIYNVDKPSGSNTLAKSFDPNATAEEKKFLSDPNSQLSKVRSQQVTSSNPNATVTQKSALAQAGGGSGNAANKPESEDGQQGNTTASEFNQEQLNASISDAGVRQQYGNYKYPIDAQFNLQDCIKFSMYRYTPKKFNVTQNLGGFSGSNKGSAMGTVTLPIQPGISDSNVVQWGESSLNSLQALAGAAALAGIQKGGEGLGESLEQISTGLRDKGKSGDIKAGLAAYFAGEAAGANTGFLTRATGAVLNNNLELLFQGPSLRSFTFNFSLSAREKKEAEEIRKIIRLFKQGMSVKRSSSALFLKTPNIFDIQYLHKGKEHPYINQIKTCALQNFVVNYTPAGNYATYEDGAMTQYDLTLTFGEIEPLFDDDYGQSDDGKIGY